MISEWGTTASDGSSGFYKDNSDLWLSFLNDNNISWLNFNLSDVYWNNTPYDSSVVQMGKWNSKLKDYILSESGKYIKNVLTNNNNYSKKNMLMSRKDDYAFFKDEYKNIIKHIEFKNNNYIPDNYDISWDVSLTLNNTVKAYLVNDTLYISSIDDVLYAPSSMKYYFSQFTNLESVNFTNLNTSEVNNMSYLFYKCSKLNSINYSNIDTSKVTNISLMYSNCTSLTNVDMSNLDFSKVTDISLMFIWASKLNTVKLPYLNEQIITKKNDVFYKSASQTSSWKLYIDINNQNYIYELINNSTNPNLNYTLIPN
jgi:surface protein